MKCKRGYSKEKGKCVKNKTYFNNKNSINWDSMWIFVTIFGILLMAGIFFYGGNQGWFKSLTVIEDTDLISYLDTPNHEIDYSCSLALSPGSIYVGDRTTGTIVDGKNSFCQVFANDGTQWLKVYEGYADANGVLVNTRTINTVGSYVFRAICDLNNNNRVDLEDCLTNPAELEVLPRPDDTPPVDEGYNVGDNVGSGSAGSGNGNFGDDFITSPIILDWTTGGPYVLGARIIRSWNYVDPQCEPTLPQQYPVEWTLYDSNGMAWQKYDYVPVNGAVDYVCPLTYHEDAPWKFVVSVGIQDCEIEYSWSLQPYICEINE